MNQDNKFNLSDKHFNDHEAFPVPEGYFEKLPDVIMQKINALESSGTNEKLPTVSDRPKGIVIQLITWASSAAAVLLISFGISNYFNDGSKSLASSITVTDIIESGVLYEFDENLLAEHVQVETEDPAIFYENESEIGDYLIEHGSDISTLINE